MKKKLDLSHLKDRQPQLGGQESRFLDRSPAAGFSGKPPLALIATLLIFVFLFLAAWYFFLKPTVREEGGKIEIFLEGSTPFFANSQAIAKAFSSCGAFALYLDNVEIATGDARAEAAISPPAGTHTLQARSTACAAALDFLVLEKQCDGSETTSCAVNGCEGVKKCFDGLYSDCMLPKKICVPGEKTSCSTDGCKFGYATCNSCGTGFGKCLPPDMGTPGCTGPECT